MLIKSDQIGAGGGVSVFTGLTDVPPSYAGQAFKTPRVNSGASALAFYDSSFIDIRDYGAVDGQDSGAAINAAFTAASSGPGRLFIPAGTFWAETSIVLQNNVSVFGCGPKSIIKAKGSLNTPVFTGTTKSLVTLDKFSIDGNKANQSSTSAKGIVLSGCSNIDITRLDITACYDRAIRAEGASSKIRIKENYLHNTGIVDQVPAVNIVSSNKILAEGNIIIASGGFGMVFNGATDSVIALNIIEDSTLYDGMLIINCNGISVVGNEVKNVYDSGIVFELTNYFTATGNTIQRAGYVGMYVIGSSYGTVAGNIFKDNGQNNHATQRHDILITRSGTTPATHNVVNGNTCHATAAIKARYGIQEEYSDCDSNIITNNQVIGQTVAPISVLGAATITANNITA